MTLLDVLRFTKACNASKYAYIRVDINILLFSLFVQFNGMSACLDWIHYFFGRVVGSKGAQRFLNHIGIF